MKITEKRLRSARWLIGDGIEIGALHNPLPVPEGAHARYVDRLSVDDLRREHPALADEKLAPVDIVCSAEDLSSIPTESQDFVIANRVLERLEHPLRGLTEMARVLRPGGILHLALSEPRVNVDGECVVTKTDQVADGIHDVSEPTSHVSHAAGPRQWRPDGFLELIAAARQEAGVALELVEFSACRPGLDDEYIFVFAKGALVPAPPREDPARVECDRLRAEVASLQPALSRANRQLAETQGFIVAVQRAIAFRAADAATRVARRLLPPETRRRHAAMRVLRWPTEPDGPSAPSRHHVLGTPGGPGAALQRVAARGAAGAQRIEVMIQPRRGGSLEATLRSLREQSWEGWRATVLGARGARDDGNNPAVDARLRRHRGRDAAAINRALEDVPGSAMVIFLAAGDTLVPGCLFEVAACVRRDPLVDLVTWDDEVRARRGLRRDLRLRPSWSPDMLLSADYLDACFAIRASRIRSAGGLCVEAGTALLWDLILRSELSAERVARVPMVLTRCARALSPSPRDAVRAVDGALRRHGWQAAARWDGEAVRVDWQLATWPRVSVIVPTRHNRALVGPLLEGLADCDYPDLEVIVVDNGPRTPENEHWYEREPMDPTVVWWDRPFNYSAVNNAGSRVATGSVLLFLNDDIRMGDDRGWLKEMVGWTSVDEVGSVGIQLLDPQGRIQHGGVILGLTGFAGHLFAGLPPRTSTLLGSTSWYRDVLAVTAACVAVRRRDFEAVGGFDEAFTLCGGDVVLGLSLRHRGLRSVCVPSNALTHIESATRGTTVPPFDFLMSWWRYQRWIRSGDPNFHPRLSLQSSVPRLRRRGEPTAVEMAEPHLGRQLAVWHSEEDLGRAADLARRCRIDPAEVAAVEALHRTHGPAAAPRTVNWYIPGIDSPFYGGTSTLLRIAAKLAAGHGVENRFVVCGVGPEGYIRSAIATAFPTLAASPVCIAEHDEELDSVPEADVAVATLWTTAYQVAASPRERRKFYLVQDFEPMFYPAGTLYALAEESYRLGLYGICNTENLARIYRTYGGTAWHFTPAVDTAVFHARGRVERGPDAPVTLFVYARPGHWRNCWELALPALNELKDRLGDRIRIVAAGSWAEAATRLPSMTHLGLIDYVDTGDLYRRCDMGLVLTVSEHPSYLPLELMACGAPVVAFDNPAGGWLLRDGVNCLLSPRTVDGLVDQLETMAVDSTLRRQLAAQALTDIAERHSDWDAALGGLYAFLTDPERRGSTDASVRGAAGTHRGRRSTSLPGRRG